MLGTETAFRRRLLRWYDAHRRDLPWRAPLAVGASAGLRQGSKSDNPARPERGTRVDPYHVLVSELMLQQTQVATVVPYFERFIARFPTLGDLAAAPQQEVLRLWQGLGYYARARNLQATAQAVMLEHGGALPADLDLLLALPGVGRYTAGAIASIAFGLRAPILDGNVARVLCRLNRIEGDPRDPSIRNELWRCAEALTPRDRPGDFNSAMMELGALICAPRSPRCMFCPVAASCAALAGGVAQNIPPPRKSAPTPLHHRDIFCIERGGRWLIEKRPITGRWAGLWQFITLEREGCATTGPLDSRTLPARGGDAGLAPVSTRLCESIGFVVSPPTPLGQIVHALTHRRYEFNVYRCDAGKNGPRPGARGHQRRWVALDQMAQYPLPRPHVKVCEMLRCASA